MSEIYWVSDDNKSMMQAHFEIDEYCSEIVQNDGQYRAIASASSPNVDFKVFEYDQNVSIDQQRQYNQNNSTTITYNSTTKQIIYEDSEAEAVTDLTENNHSRILDQTTGNEAYVTYELSDKTQEVDNVEMAQNDCEIFYIIPQHKCNICEEVFNVVDMLSEHLAEKHMTENDFNDQCLICGLLFKTPLALSLHLSKKHVTINPYRCKYCGRRFPCREDLNDHIKYLHSCLISPYRCNTCGRSFKFLCDVHSHKAISHREIFNCPYCVKCYEKNEDLMFHLKIHVYPEKYHDKLPLDYDEIQIQDFEKQDQIHLICFNKQNFGEQCFVCGAKNTDLKIMEKFENFEDHILSHSEDNHINCHICQEKFNDFTKFYEHQRDHLLMKLNVASLKHTNFSSATVRKIHCGFSTRPPTPNFEGETSEALGDTGIMVSNKTDDTKKPSAVKSCILCKKSFKMNSTNEYEQHMKKHSSSINLRNVAPLGLVKWMNTNTQNLYPYYCKLCKRYFVLATSLLLHNKKVHKKMRPHRCSICNMEFAQSSELVKHGNAHPGIKKFACKICKYKFVEKRNLQKHKQHHRSSTRCIYCGVDCGNKNSLEKHTKKHIGEIVKECDFCEAPYVNEQDLNLHISRSHNINPEMWQCRICRQQCTSAADVLRHNRSEHAGERPYKCEHCDKSFSLLHSLVNHRVVHTQSKNHKCEFCGKAFSYASYLKMHLRLHTGERPYICSDCPKTFARQADLYEHKKTHSFNAQFTCETCGKTFEKQEVFNKHKMIHNGIKPYKCGNCPKEFTQRSALEIHSYLHSEIRKFSCSVCSKLFVSPFDMLRHEKKVHCVFKTSDELKKIIKNVLKSEAGPSKCDESSDYDIETDEFDENDDEEFVEDDNDVQVSQIKNTTDIEMVKAIQHIIE